jgi:4-hydroxy-tetrahydrodipicolinate synthase
MELPRKFTALVTPFLPNGEINYSGLQENVEFQIQHKWAPLVLGTTGEAPTVGADEFLPVVSAVVEQTNGRMPVMVGTGTNSTRMTFEKTRAARDAGADIALVVMPYYNKPEPAGQLAHFREAARPGLPIVMYDVATRTAREIDYGVIETLAKDELFIGYKAATHKQVKTDDGVRPLSARVAQELSSDTFHVWSGDDMHTVDRMRVGAYGVISVASNVAPVKVGQVVDAAAIGNWDTADKYHSEWTPLFAALFKESNPIPVKAAMNIRHKLGRPGMNAGPCRLPLSEARGETKELLTEYLTKVQLL